MEISYTHLAPSPLVVGYSLIQRLTGAVRYRRW
jgi:hypothetical protein